VQENNITYFLNKNKMVIPPFCYFLVHLCIYTRKVEKKWRNAHSLFLDCFLWWTIGTTDNIYWSNIVSNRFFDTFCLLFITKVLLEFDKRYISRIYCSVSLLIISFTYQFNTFTDVVTKGLIALTPEKVCDHIAWAYCLSRLQYFS
jgi:uncharacterized membrane protein YfhO